MKLQVLLCLVFVFCFSRADERQQDQAEPGRKYLILEDDESKTSSVVESDQEQQLKKKGFCHWGVREFFKPGSEKKCSCMKCLCVRGKWDCSYWFAYCPYFYCGGKIYNPNNQLCCCGKIYTKKAAFSCCGYAYYDTRKMKCCNFYTVKPKNVNCPRSQIGIPIKG